MTVQPKPTDKTMTSHEFHEKPREAMRAAKDGPVVITDHDDPAHEH